MTIAGHVKCEFEPLNSDQGLQYIMRDVGQMVLGQLEELHILLFTHDAYSWIMSRPPKDDLFETLRNIVAAPDWSPLDGVQRRCPTLRKVLFTLQTPDLPIITQLLAADATRTLSVVKEVAKERLRAGVMDLLEMKYV